MRRLVFAATLAAASLTPSRASACINSRMYSLDNATRELDQAERDLERGDYSRALAEAQRANVNAPAFDRRRPPGGEEAQRRAEERRPELARRRDRVIAIAQLRLGRAKVAKPALEALLGKQPDDPGLQARFAEALVATGDKARGFEMLIDLETRDLMPDAAGWLALAKLRDDAGDIDARGRALAGCKAIATSPRSCTFAFKARPAKAPKPGARKA
jgi:predicted Zn-dependent protease